MGDVVDLVLVQADAFHEIDLNLVAGGDASGECRARQAAMLRHGKDRRDVVARMRIVGGEEGVVEVEFAHRHAVGPCRPFRRDALGGGKAEYGSAGQEGVSLRLRPGARHRAAHQRCGGNRRIVDDAIADHLDHIGVERDVVCGDRGDLPGELVFAGQIFGGFVGADLMRLHE
jgi:hypothetical protein